MTAWTCRVSSPPKGSASLPSAALTLSTGAGGWEGGRVPHGASPTPGGGGGEPGTGSVQTMRATRSSGLLGGPRVWGRNQLPPPSRLESKGVEVTVPHVLLRFTGRKLLGRTPLQKHKFSPVRTGTGAGGRSRGLC